MLTTALTDCAQRGFLDPAEIPWLARIPARRFARRYAERVGGTAARRTMVAYQNEAVELGFLHSRYLRGVAPPDFAELGQEHVERMRALRPALLWPQPTGDRRPVADAHGRRAGPGTGRRSDALRALVGGASSGRGPGGGDRSAQMLTTLTALREALRSTPGCRWRSPASRRAGPCAAEMIDQLEDYVLPRLVQIDAPLLTVVGGSTGAGKSTLVNSLVGERVSEPGVLRPTTRSPVLVHHPDDAEWFDQQRILPELERTTRATADPGALQLVASTAIPQGLALLDAPDIDSVEERNRSLAAQLLAAADLWLFVTSAARYADQVPWGFLKQAAERSAAVAIVLDRTAPRPHPRGEQPPRADAGRPRAEGLAAVHRGRGARSTSSGLLPAASVADIRGWLTELGADVEARNGVVRQTLDGAVRSIARRTYELADACQAQADMQARLKRDVDVSYDQAVADIDKGSADGTLLRGEVLARWQEFVGTGELLRNLESKVSWLRDRITNAVKGKPQQAERVTVAVESGLQTLILEHAEAAAERTDASWRSVAAGTQVLDEGGADLSRASRDFRARTERMVRDWQNGVLDLVRSEGADKRTTARFLAYGVNGLSVALMVVVFASTGGVTGAEVGIAGGSAVVGQKLLEAVFGDQAVRRLALNARRDLATRVEALMDQERQRFVDRLDALELPTDSAEQLRALARKVDDLRFATARSGS